MAIWKVRQGGDGRKISAVHERGGCGLGQVMMTMTNSDDHHHDQKLFGVIFHHVAISG